MVTKEELEKSTFLGRHVTVWFMFSWALVMFILDGVVYKVKAPPGESDWEYGPSVFLMCLVRARAIARRRTDGRTDAGDARRRRGDARDGERFVDRSARGGTREGAIATRATRGTRAALERIDTSFIRAKTKRVRETDETTRAFVRFDAQIAACVWSAFSIRKTETAHAAELKRLRETKTLAELMSLNMGA